jgi:glycosyltransferase involved in cell wall biosynthesis
MRDPKPLTLTSALTVPLPTRLRILALHAEFGTLRGGGESFSRNLFASLAALGHQVTVAFAADPFGRYPYAVPVGIEAMPIRGWWARSLGQATLSRIGRRLTSMGTLRTTWDRLQDGLGWRASYWNNYRFQKRVVKQLEHAIKDVDVVYVHSNPFLASAVAQMRPTVLRLPGPLTSESLPLLRSIDAVCANGDALTRIRDFLGGHAIELPVGLDHHLFVPGPSSIRASFGWATKEKIVGYVGRLSRIKGVDVLAEGFKEIARVRSDVRLLVVGSGEEENNVRGVLQSEIARGLVHFTGDVPHEQLADWYRAMDLLVMPSRYENYSNAILEALACGVPFVGSNVGGNRTLFETGAGWLFEAGSPASLAAMVNHALADPDNLTARGNNGRMHVCGRHSWCATARRFEEIVHDLLVQPIVAARHYPS